MSEKPKAASTLPEDYGCECEVEKTVLGARINSALLVERETDSQRTGSAPLADPRRRLIEHPNSSRLCMGVLPERILDTKLERIDKRHKRSWSKLRTVLQ